MLPHPEPHSFERPRSHSVWRRFALSTPLVCYLTNENTKLSFLPPRAYYAFVKCAFAIGIGALVLGVMPQLGFASYGESLRIVGFGFPLAAVWALASIDRISFNLRQGTYSRFTGFSSGLKMRQGRFEELDALVVIAVQGSVSELSTSIPGGIPNFLLVLHWKNRLQPPFVLEKSYSPQPLLSHGSECSGMLKLPLFDNSHFISPNPEALF